MVGMSALSVRDADRILDLATAILDGLADGPPWRLIATEINTCLRGTATIYHGALRLTSRTTRDLTWAPDCVTAVPWARYTRELSHFHPLAQLYASGASIQPLTVSDVASDLVWRRNPCYDSTNRVLDGSVRHLALPLPSPEGSIRSFVTCRSGRDYDDRERALAARLQPLLISVDRYLTQMQRLTVSAQADSLGVTPRERVVLNVLAGGLTAAAAARRLGISPHTVNKHLENVYRKLGTRDRSTTMLRAMELGMLTASTAARSVRR
jgi:DNA-binding CsgD family transcriptional regulator